MENGGVPHNFHDNDSNSSSPSYGVFRLAIDIGGSLIKVVYFSTKSVNHSTDTQNDRTSEDTSRSLSGNIFRGMFHFVKFETRKIDDCLEFMTSKLLHRSGGWQVAASSNKNVIKATGGGAFKFADLFREKLDISLDKVDEMHSLVTGANFLLKAVPLEAFTYIDGHKEYLQIDHNDLYPYLLVNIGSGVSMIKVDANERFERISGTSIGGGTFLGLGKLLTKCKSFDELLELSQKGDHRAIDMLVGDIYGRMNYSKIGLPSRAIASSFGKVISENKELEDYRAQDIARSLLRLISNNIGQIAYLNALRFGLKRIFFGGFFIRDHAYTMDTISVAVNYWSKGEAQALFLRHEGYLGALGAFMSYDKHGSGYLVGHHPLKPFSVSTCPEEVSRDPILDDDGNESIECTLQLSS